MENQAGNLDKENVDTTNIEGPKIYTVESKYKQRFLKHYFLLIIQFITLLPVLRMIKELQQQHGKFCL